MNNCLIESVAKCRFHYVKPCTGHITMKPYKWIYSNLETSQSIIATTALMSLSHFKLVAGSFNFTFDFFNAQTLNFSKTVAKTKYQRFLLTRDKFCTRVPQDTIIQEKILVVENYPYKWSFTIAKFNDSSFLAEILFTFLSPFWIAVDAPFRQIPNWMISRFIIERCLLKTIVMDPTHYVRCYKPIAYNISDSRRRRKSFFGVWRKSCEDFEKDFPRVNLTNFPINFTVRNVCWTVISLISFSFACHNYHAFTYDFLSRNSADDFISSLLNPRYFTALKDMHGCERGSLLNWSVTIEGKSLLTTFCSTLLIKILSNQTKILAKSLINIYYPFIAHHLILRQFDLHAPIQSLIIHPMTQKHQWEVVLF